jgi:hypothetical protein
LDLWIQRLDDLGRRDDAGLFALVNQLREVLAFEGAHASEDLVEHEAEGVDVAARRDLGTGELLRGHVRRCAGAQRFTRRAGESEVRDPHLARPSI